MTEPGLEEFLTFLSILDSRRPRLDKIIEYIESNRLEDLIAILSQSTYAKAIEASISSRSIARFDEIIYPFLEEENRNLIQFSSKGAREFIEVFNSIPDVLNLASCLSFPKGTAVHKIKSSLIPLGHFYACISNKERITMEHIKECIERSNIIVYIEKDNFEKIIGRRLDVLKQQIEMLIKVLFQLYKVSTVLHPQEYLSDLIGLFTTINMVKYSKLLMGSEFQEIYDRVFQFLKPSTYTLWSHTVEMYDRELDMMLQSKPHEVIIFEAKILHDSALKQLMSLSDTLDYLGYFLVKRYYEVPLIRYSLLRLFRRE